MGDGPGRHADAETTMRIYSQLLKRRKRAAFGRRFDALVTDAQQALGAVGDAAWATLDRWPSATQCGVNVGMKRELARLRSSTLKFGKEKEPVFQALSRRARRDSNARPSVPETDALSPELRALADVQLTGSR
jgi:hypothetical protein